MGEGWNVGVAAGAGGGGGGGDGPQLRPLSNQDYTRRVFGLSPFSRIGMLE